MMNQERSRRTTLAVILMGVGMGGFVDGILLHQIFQWHNMISNWLPPTTMEAMSLNMLWDGIFHAFVWSVTLVGIFMFRNAAYRREAIPPVSAFVGQLLLGWGLFNLFEGVINHQLLELHHVRQVPEYAVYNLSFLAIGGLLFIVAGWKLMGTNHGSTETS